MFVKCITAKRRQCLECILVAAVSLTFVKCIAKKKRISWIYPCCSNLTLVKCMATENSDFGGRWWGGGENSQKDCMMLANCSHQLYSPFDGVFFCPQKLSSTRDVCYASAVDALQQLRSVSWGWCVCACMLVWECGIYVCVHAGVWVCVHACVWESGMCIHVHECVCERERQTERQRSAWLSWSAAMFVGIFMPFCSAFSTAFSPMDKLLVIEATFNEITQVGQLNLMTDE